MPRWLQIVLHIVTTGAGAYLAYSNGTPLPAVVATGISAVVGIAAHAYNPDGTPAEEPYIPHDQAR